MKEEEQAWDPNTQRNRRKVVFAEMEEGSDVSGSSDEDEDEDDESDDGDQEEQEEDKDEDNLSTFLKEARAKSYTGKKNVREPPQVKKQKLERKEEIPVFADSEDELEISEEEGEGGRPGDSGNCSEESDDDDDEETEDDDENSEDESMEDEVEAADATVKKQSASEEEEEEEQGKYTVFGFISLQIHFCSNLHKKVALIWFFFFDADSKIGVCSVLIQCFSLQIYLSV